MSSCVSASVAGGFDPDVRGGSCLACQRRLGLGENCGGIGSTSADGAKLVVETLGLTEACAWGTQCGVSVASPVLALAC